MERQRCTKVLTYEKVSVKIIYDGIESNLQEGINKAEELNSGTIRYEWNSCLAYIYITDYLKCSIKFYKGGHYPKYRVEVDICKDGLWETVRRDDFGSYEYNEASNVFIKTTDFIESLCFDN